MITVLIDLWCAFWFVWWLWVSAAKGAATFWFVTALLLILVPGSFNIGPAWLRGLSTLAAFGVIVFWVGSRWQDRKKRRLHHRSSP